MSIGNSSSRILSFKYAIRGILTALKEEPNLKFHFLAAIAAVFLSYILNLSRGDFIIIILLIGFVISLELTNTAIEAVVDAFTDKEHPRAKLAKDISAGAVLAAAVTAGVLGMIIFLPYLNTFLNG